MERQTQALPTFKNLFFKIFCVSALVAIGLITGTKLFTIIF